MTERKPTCVACKGAGGANYTAGTGIVIEDKEISADTSVLATKTELPDMDDYQPKLTAGTGINIDTDNVISATGGGEFTILTSTDWVAAGVVEVSDDYYYITFLKDCLLIITVSNKSSMEYFPKGVKIRANTRTNLMFVDSIGMIFTSLSAGDMTNSSVNINTKAMIDNYTSNEVSTTDPAGYSSVNKLTVAPSTGYPNGAYLYVKE